MEPVQVGKHVARLPQHQLIRPHPQPLLALRARRRGGARASLGTPPHGQALRARTVRGAGRGRTASFSSGILVSSTSFLRSSSTASVSAAHSHFLARSSTSDSRFDGPAPSPAVAGGDAELSAWLMRREPAPVPPDLLKLLAVGRPWLDVPSVEFFFFF